MPWVPEITDEMCIAGMEASKMLPVPGRGRRESIDTDEARDIFLAMCAAAPAADAVREVIEAAGPVLEAAEYARAVANGERGTSGWENAKFSGAVSRMKSALARLGRTG